MSPEPQTTYTTVYIALVTAGLLMLCVEIFIPGGVLGVLGGLALLVAVVVGFFAFPSPYDLVSAGVIFVLAGFSLFMAIRIFPRSRVGRMLTLSNTADTWTSTQTTLPEMAGKRGEALTDLRPGGLARIDGQRVDVVAEGRWVGKGETVKVVEVEGNRVTVRRIENKGPFASRT